MKITRITPLILFFVLGILISGCVDVPDNVAPPRYDVKVNFPGIDTSYVLDDAIGKDSTIQVSKDPNTLGLLYFEQTENISTFKIEDNLTLSDFSTYFSKTIGSVKINDVDPISIGIKVEDWTTNVQSGTNMIFPENVGDLVIPFKKIKQFESVSLDNGNLKIKIVNRLPVDIQLQGIKVKNAIAGTYVADIPASSPVDLQPLDSAEINVDLAGKTIEDSLIYIGRIYTPGSHGQLVQIPEGAGTNITIFLSNLEISSVRAVLPQQDPFVKNGTVSFDDSTYLTEAVFDKGSFNIEFNNHLDLAIKLDLTINNLKKADGSAYTESITLQKNENHKVISYPSVSGWAIKSDNLQTPTNELSYGVTVTALATNEPSTLSKNDSISVKIDFKDIGLRSVAGKLKPTKFSIAESHFGMDMGDIKNKFSFDQIDLNDPAIKLTMSSSAKMNMELNAKLTATNGNQTKVLDLNNVMINSPGTNVIDLRDYGLKDFLNGFSKALPDSFTFSGSAIVNPQYEIGQVSKDDSIAGGVSIQIPLDIGIKGGSFKDTVKFDADISDDDIDAIREAALTLEITNGLPVGVIFTGAVLDSTTDKELFPLPPPGSSNDKLEIPAPTVDADGFVTEAGKNKQVIVLNSDQAKQLIHNGKIALKLQLFTPPKDVVTPVKFRNTDYIGVKVYGSVVYRVNN